MHLKLYEGLRVNVGYARVSTSSENLDNQIEQLKIAGCEKIFSEKKSGKNEADRREFSRKYGHKPIIDINPKNSKELKAKIELIEHEEKAFNYLNQHLNLDKEHYNQRSMVERVNKYLKDDFGCNKIYYQGANKVASVLAFAILSVCVHQSLKLMT